MQRMVPTPPGSPKQTNPASIDAYAMIALHCHGGERGPVTLPAFKAFLTVPHVSASLRSTAKNPVFMGFP